MSDCQSRSCHLSALLLGALIGAGIVYYLTSTEEGQKTKKQLAGKSKDALNTLGELIRELEEKGDEFRQKAKKLQAELETKTKDVQKEVVEEAEEQLTKMKALRERGRKATKLFFTQNGKSLA